MIISKGWAEARWWKKAILSPGQPTCSRHVCAPALGLPGPTASSPTSTPAAGILPTLEVTAPISPAESRPPASDLWWHPVCSRVTLSQATCTFTCPSLLESRGHFVLSHRAHSRCMQIFAKGKEDKRRMRGNSCFENFTMERTFETRGAYHSPTESG